MPIAPTPADIYRRAVEEGRRRLRASLLELVASGFNAGFTIVFGIATLGIVHALAEPRFGSAIAQLAGAGGFAVGLVFLVLSRSELFTENFFDPVATAFDERSTRVILQLLRLWIVVLGSNLVGGAILAVILSVDGVMPSGAEASLRSIVEAMVAQDTAAAFANALVGGALVTLLSFLLQAVDSDLSRMLAAALVGFVLAVGPFAHVVVTFQHLMFGVLGGAAIDTIDIARETGLAVIGNLIGGLGFVTLTHIAQARAADRQHE